MIINDSDILGNDYGVVIEFPSNPSKGDTFSVSTNGDIETVNAGSFIPGNEYTILSPGNTNWNTIGAANNYQGFTFTATGAGSGTGTATIPVGVQRRIYQPAQGQRAKTLHTGVNGSSFYFGPDESVKAVYITTGSQFDGQPTVWVYDGNGTWIQMYF